MDWTECEIVECVAEKVSGTPVLVGTRIPADALISNVDAFMEVDGLSLNQAVIATSECFHGAAAKSIQALLEFRIRRQLQY